MSSFWTVTETLPLPSAGAWWCNGVWSHWLDTWERDTLPTWNIFS